MRGFVITSWAAFTLAIELEMTPLEKVLGISLARPALGSKRRLTLLPAINMPSSAAAYPLHEGTYRLSAVIELSAGYEIGNRGFLLYLLLTF